MSQTAKVSSAAKRDGDSKKSTGKARRVLPQIPLTENVKSLQTSLSAQTLSKQSPTHYIVAKGNEPTIDLTTVSELSCWTPNSTQTLLLEGSRHQYGVQTPVREFVSPVKFVSEGEDSCVTVAVRVRPFSQREQLLPSMPVIRMHGNETIIKSQDGVVHRFYFDHCFWSMPEEVTQGGVVSGRDLSPKFATQDLVYKELAQPLLDRSFEGYNTCLFAYGQTGSGKSYCIMGEGEAIGIVPQFTQELFERIEGPVDDVTSYKVQVSFYEIYKERIHDLLASTSIKKKLKVREHPVLGPYVEDLSTFVANSYSDIERWIHLGNRFRATAATGMNERSSRSHSVFTITLTQTEVFEGEDQSKVSRINLIDLAGSERSSVSKTSGERLKEGASINKSLHSLGKVISLLSDKGTGRRKKVFIPYRDSTLTWLLKESLGGNSKTAMIATISPSVLHYDESLSTLRYAQQARSIVNVARINEDSNAAVIRDLRQEIEELKAMVQMSRHGWESGGHGNVQELDELQEKLVESEKLMVESSRSWQEKLRASELRKQEEMELLKKSGALTINNRLPNLVNLTEDPQLSEMLLYVLKEGVTTIGRKGEAGSASPPHDIELSGVLVMSGHCSIQNDNGSVTLCPSANTEAQTFLNGHIIVSSIQLHHGDRIVLGGEYFFRFNHPLEVEKGVTFKKGQGTFEYAKNELIRAQTARLEAELEEKRLREREKMIAELQLLKDAAQEDIDNQRVEYEDKLAQLSRDMVEQSVEVSHHQQFSEETQQKMEQLLLRNKLLEEETMAQKHVIHLEKIKADKEFVDLKEQKTRLLSDLEQERNKLVADISQLHKNKSFRETSSNRRESTISLSSTSSEPSLMRGSELVRIAMMLQEASAISKSLNKPLTFSREELASDDGGHEVQVRVSNTQLGLVTFWNLEKFESRLESMRDQYQSLPTAPIGSATSIDGENINSMGEENDPFTDPTDVWVKEDLLSPHPSPIRSSHIRALLLSNHSTKSSTFTVSTTTSLPPRSLMDIFNSSLGSRGGSPLLPVHQDTDLLPQSTSYSQINPSLPSLCYEQISGMLTVHMSIEGSLYEATLKHVSAVRESSQYLKESFERYSPQPDTAVPFSGSPKVCEACLSLYTSLELLLAVGRCLQRDLLQWEGFLACFTSSSAREEGVLKEKLEGFIETICQQTALYCSKLLQGVDKEVEDTINESCSSLQESLDFLTQQTGGLCLSKRVIDKLLAIRMHAIVADWLEGGAEENEFLSFQPYQKSAILFYKGHCEWCTLTFELTHQKVLEYLRVTSDLTDSYPEAVDLVNSICKMIVEVASFLHRLSEMQVDIWNLDDLATISGTLPVVPNMSNVVDLLAQLHEIESSIIAVSDCTRELVQDRASSVDKLSSSKGQVASNCNKLAACTLTVIKSSSSCTHAQELTVEIQQLSHAITKADKTINHLLRNDRHVLSSKKVSIRQTPNIGVEELPGTGPIDKSLPVVTGNKHGHACKQEVGPIDKSLPVVTGNKHGHACKQEVTSGNVTMTNVEPTNQLGVFPEQVENSAVPAASQLDSAGDDSTLI